MTELCRHDLEPTTCSLCKPGPRDPLAGHTADCRTCGATVAWVITAKGKLMPIDAEPSPDGQFRLAGTSGSEIRVAFVKPEDRPTATVALRTSHFATCPDADMHRHR